MAAQQQVSLFKQLGARIAEAHEASKDAPVNFGNQGIPAGIENGIAQLTVMEFIEGKKPEDKGKYYFRAAGVVQEPKVFDGAKVEGRQTHLLIPMFDTPNRTSKKRFADHWADYLNLFKQFAVSMPPGQQLGESKEASSSRIEQYFQAAAAALVKQGVYFGFRTWKGAKQATGPYANKEPRVNEEWQGIVEYSPGGAAANPAAGFNDQSAGQQLPPNGQHQTANTNLGPRPFEDTPTPQPATSRGAASPPVTGQQPQHQPDDGLPDIVALAEMADADPQGETDDGNAAIAQLVEIARQRGITDEQLGSVGSWGEVIAQPWWSGNGSPAGAPAAAKPAPVKGAAVTYNGGQCEVTSVNEQLRTVTLKGPDKKAMFGPPGPGGKKELLKVPFDQLS